MNVCPNCRYSSHDSLPFCPNCGSRMVTAAKPAVYPYVFPASPEKAPQPSKGKAIAGGILAIFGFSLAILQGLATLGLLDGGVYGEAFSFALVFCIFTLPLTIVGLVLSISARRSGSTSAMAKVGKILGLIGVIIVGVSVMFSTVSLLYDDYYHNDLDDYYDDYDDYYDDYDDYYYN